MDTIPEEVWLIITLYFTHYELTLMVLMYVSKYFKKVSVKLLYNCKSIQYMKMCDEAASAGDLEVLKWFIGLGYKYDHYTCKMAAKHGHLAVLRYLISYNSFLDQKICNAAARYGHFELLKWMIIQKNYPIYNKIIIKAAKSNKLEVLKWVYTMFDTDMWFIIMIDTDIGPKISGYAASGKNIEMLEWAKPKACYHPPSFMYKAAKHGHFDLVKIVATEILSNPGHSYLRYQLRYDVCSGAAKGGHLEILKWALEPYKWFDPQSIFLKASESGHLEIIKWTYDQCNKGCETVYISIIRRGAIKYSHLPILKWLEEMGYDFSLLDAFLNAMYIGNIEVLNWLKDDKKYIGPMSYKEAIEVGQWMKINRKYFGTNLVMSDSKTARLHIDRHNENFAKYT